MFQTIDNYSLRTTAQPHRSLPISYLLGAVKNLLVGGVQKVNTLFLHLHLLKCFDELHLTGQAQLILQPIMHQMAEMGNGLLLEVERYVNPLLARRGLFCDTFLQNGQCRDAVAFEYPLTRLCIPTPSMVSGKHNCKMHVAFRALLSRGDRTSIPICHNRQIPNILTSFPLAQQHALVMTSTNYSLLQIR